jgi:hypothetical protein
MSFDQPLGHLNRNIQRLGLRKRSLNNLLPQALALDIFHGDKEPTLLFANLVDGADIIVGKRRGGFGLPDKTLSRLGVLGQLRRQKFQGYRPLEFGVFGFIDNPHAAFSQLVDNRVFPGDHAFFARDL